MKILLSCVPFDGGESGISVYIRHIVQELASQGQELTLIVENDAAAFFPSYDKIIIPKICDKAVFSMLYHLFVLPFRTGFRKYDMFMQCAANRRAVCWCPIFTVAVVHDLSQYHVNKKYDILRTIYIKHVLPFFVRKAQAVVAVSKSTAVDLVKYWRIKEQKIHVIYNGLSINQNEAQKDDFNSGQGFRRPFILYVSRIEHPGKNHVNLIRAYNLLPPEITEHYDLMLPGKLWNGAEEVVKEAKASPHQSNIHLPGFVEPSLLKEMYENAACYVFPSLYEGFGLSMLEAMHYGVPCACSNCSSLSEIGDGASLLFDPNDPQEIADAIKELLLSEAKRNSLKEAGTKRAELFSWKKAAERFIELPSRPRIFGVPCDNVTMKQALEYLDELVRQRSSFVAFINAHCLNVAYRDREYAKILNSAAAVWPDGSGIRLAGRILHFSVPENVNGTDMFPLICEKHYSIYMLGAAPGVAAAAMEKARLRFPNAKFVGSASGFFADEGEEKAVIAEINALNPDILLVAMGVPLQEKWIARHRNELVCGVAMAVGGLLDFVSERIPRAPLWMRRAGLEWCFRLYKEPLRLFRRYIIGNPLFVIRLLRN